MLFVRLRRLDGEENILKGMLNLEMKACPDKCMVPVSFDCE